MTFERAFALTNGEEGGYSNRPADRGGITYRGFTQRLFTAWITVNGLYPERDKDVTTATDAELLACGYTVFWKGAHCDDAPERSGCMHYDMAFNHGAPNAVRLLQEALGLVVDGYYGPKTEAATRSANDLELLAALFVARKAFYDHIIATDPLKDDPILSQKNNYNGWMNRLRDLKAALE